MPTIGVVLPRPLRDQLFTPAAWQRLHGLGTVRAHDGDQQLDGAQAAELLAGCEVGIGSWGTPHPGTPDLLAACPELRLWEHAAGTVKRMFGDHLAGRELTIASCKTAIAEDVAEMVLGEIILGVRGWRVDADANRERERGPKARGVCYGRRVGIVGMSEVGKRVTTLLAQLDVEVLAYDPYCPAEDAATHGVRLVGELPVMCGECDVLSVHLPALESTRHLVDGSCFAALPDHALVINTSRGSCIDQDALQRELEAGRLEAMLDVTPPEPLPADHPLRRLPSCTITSHIAGPRSPRIGDQAVDDVAAFLAGREPLCVVRAETLEITA